MTPPGGPILLYDGVCGLCNRLVQFVLKRDRRKQFRFAPLQGELAARVLHRHGKNPADLDTVYVIVSPEQPEERLLPRSAAVIYVLRMLGRGWGLLALIGRLLPQFFTDWLYRQVARRRYRIFGRYDSCPLPSAETRARFLA
jgi:predicted DCC family thiol-disulfide oxidoreductase YuxK